MTVAPDLYATQTYYDGDGLLRKYGPSKAVAGVAGEYKTFGNIRTIEVKIPDMTKLTSTSSILSDQVFVPKNARLEEVIVDVDTACTGSSSTLSVGLVQTSDRTTFLHETSLVNAMALSGKLDTVGNKVVLNVGSTAAGSDLGVTLSNIYHITAKYGTAVFTAGAVTIRIQYYV